MKKLIQYTSIAIFAMCSSLFTTGCASGGYKLTRQYSGWVNRQNIILRVVLYILTLPVWMVTLLIDAVVFNTMDFWEGRVSQGSYNFKSDSHSFAVTHEFQGQADLRKSTIQVSTLGGQHVQTMVLKEKPNGQIEYLVDGQLKATVLDLKFRPEISFHDESGEVIEKRHLFGGLAQFASRL